MSRLAGQQFDRHSDGLLALFAITALASALLMFWVEPLFAKVVLPLLGGAPAVWNTCLMYFQAALLLGYLYAHVSSQYLRPRRQAWVHVALVVVAAATLPVGIPRGWTPPVSGSVIGWLVVVLTVGVGAPFVVLAATAPLLQRWISQSNRRGAANPYLLYAASNAGSLAGLLAFPILLEPHIPLSQQTRIWSFGYAVLIALLIGCAVLVWRSVQDREDSFLSRREFAATRPALSTRLRWIALAFAPSSLLLGVTSYLSTDVAAMPLLWVVPLALYLITFIAVFSREDRTPNKVNAIAQAVLVSILMLVIAWEPDLDLRWEYLLHLGAFTFTALVLHGELARSRPKPEHLTEFYLWLAFGGALGGAFNALIAPVVFKSIVEYELVIVAACFLRPSWPSPLKRIIDSRAALPVSLFLLLLIPFATWLSIGHTHLLGVPGKVVVSVLVAALLVAASWNAYHFGLGIAAVALIAFISTPGASRVVYSDRSFFGAYEVERGSGGAHFLIHGTTIHGAEFLDSARLLKPVTYYHPNGPAGQIFSALQARLPQKRIGVVGLGTGSLLCYSKPGEQWTYFEIDPLVASIARDQRLFHFVDQCPVRPNIVFGDARLTLAKQPANYFGLLIIDAFSSDAIPVHMLTREAVAQFERVLDPHGILLIHISNQHLDLEPVVAALAKDAGLFARLGEHSATSAQEGRDLDYSSDWVALAHSPEDLGTIATDPRWKTMAARADARVWTDDYSNVFSVIKW